MDPGESSQPDAPETRRGRTRFRLEATVLLPSCLAAGAFSGDHADARARDERDADHLGGVEALSE